MNKLIEKIIERLEELKQIEIDRPDYCDDGVCGDCEEIYDDGRSLGRYEQAVRIISIVNELAEEYAKDTNVPTNDGWIAVEDGLPEESGEYYTYVYYDGRYMYYIDEIDCDGIIKKWNHFADYKIIAWKPIAPYQPKGE